VTDAPLLTITDAARQKILDVRAGEPDPDSLALWFEMSGVQGNSFTFDMYFRPLDDAGADDAVQPDLDISVVVPGDSADKVRGSTLAVAGGGMVLQNPNSPRPAPAAAARPPADLSGPVAQRVLQVLNEQINPAIAAHGGRADLVAVEEPIAYLHLSGGCQGCGWLPPPCAKASRSRSSTRCPRSPRWSTPPTTPAARTRTTRPQRSRARPGYENGCASGARALPNGTRALSVSAQTRAISLLAAILVSELRSAGSCLLAVWLTEAPSHILRDRLARRRRVYSRPLRPRELGLRVYCVAFQTGVGSGDGLVTITFDSDAGGCAHRGRGSGGRRAQGHR